jgi:hypothetical protein
MDEDQILMKTFLLFMMGLTAIFSPLFAQITVHNTDFAGPGTSYTMNTATSATFSPGSAGANQSWTFGAQTFDETYAFDIIAPSAAPHNSEFPTATRASHMNDGESDLYTFERISPSAYTWLGTVTNDTARLFLQDYVIAPLPASYQNSWSSVMRYEATYGEYTVTFTDSARLTIDGWGTVTTPYGSWNALRMFSHHWVTMSMGSIPIINSQNVEYQWINQQGNPVVALSSEDDVTDPNFTSGQISMLGTPQAADPVRGPVASQFEVGQNYPNPFNPTTTLPISLDHASQVTLDIYDVNGQLVSHEVSDMPAGSHNISLNGSRWASGNYFARVQAGDKARVMKMQLVK